MIHAPRKLGVAAIVAGVLGVFGLATAASAAHIVPLHTPHQGTDFAEFQNEGDCGGLNPEDGPVWHFVANQLNGDAGTGSLTATFEDRDGDNDESFTVSASKVLKHVQHFFVQSTQPLLVDASATFAAGQPRANLVLSHVCGVETEFHCPAGTWIDENEDGIETPDECFIPA